MKTDLGSLSLKELRDLRAQVDKAIASFEDRRKKAALADVEEAAKKHGFSLSELTGGKSAKKTRKLVAPKYANPANKSETWTGRGRKPRWAEAALKAGKTLDSMKI
jgi:DNA-binding protein H-NS